MYHHRSLLTLKNETDVLIAGPSLEYETETFLKGYVLSQYKVTLAFLTSFSLFSKLWKQNNNYLISISSGTIKKKTSHLLRFILLLIKAPQLLNKKKRSLWKLNPVLTFNIHHYIAHIFHIKISYHYEINTEVIDRKVCQALYISLVKEDMGSTRYNI